MPKSTRGNKTHASTQYNFSKYKNKYPDWDQPLFPNSSILAAILNYFSKQNIQIIISGTDIFNQEHQQTKPDKNTGNQGLPKSQQKTVNQYYDDWVQLRLSEIEPQSKMGDSQKEKTEDSQQEIGKVSDFIGYLVEQFGKKIEIQWDNLDTNNDQEEKDQQGNKNQQEKDEPLQSDKKQQQDIGNQFSQRNMKSVGNTIIDRTNKNIDEDKSRFTQQEKKYLLNYYKHFCELKASLPKGKTFDDIRELHETMNLPQWMMFCKKAGVIIKNTDISHNTRHVRLQNQLTIQQLKQVFQNNQNNAKKMVFESFCGGVADVIKLIHHNNNSGNFPSTPINPKEFLGLDNESNHFDMMDVMGIRYIRQKVYFYNLSTTIEKSNKTIKKGLSHYNRSTLISNVNKSLSKQSDLKRERKQEKIKQNKANRDSLKKERLAMSLTKVSNETQRRVKDDKERSTVGAKKQIKYYRSREERKQSELLKKLKISNLKDVKPSSDVLCNLQKLGSGDQDDYFLREYNRKHRDINEGVVSRLKKNVKKMERKIR